IAALWRWTQCRESTPPRSRCAERENGGGEEGRDGARNCEPNFRWRKLLVIKEVQRQKGSAVLIAGTERILSLRLADASLPRAGILRQSIAVLHRTRCGWGSQRVG